jgi:hypothetical protein
MTVADYDHLGHWHDRFGHDRDRRLNTPTEALAVESVVGRLVTYAAAAWVSAPMTNVYSSRMMGIASEFLLKGDVVVGVGTEEHFKAGL